MKKLSAALVPVFVILVLGPAAAIAQLQSPLPSPTRQSADGRRHRSRSPTAVPRQGRDPQGRPGDLGQARPVRRVWRWREQRHEFTTDTDITVEAEASGRLLRPVHDPRPGRVGGDLQQADDHLAGH
jgi:hypothetical protein